MIYKNINESSFKAYKSKLQKIEDKIEPLCKENGFYIDKTRYYNESLVININTEDDDGFKGNISLQAIDEPGAIKFRFDLIKTYDVDNIRHYHKEPFEVKKDISFFESNMENLLQKAFSAYRKLTFDDLEEKIEMPARYT